MVAAKTKQQLNHMPFTHKIDSFRFWIVADYTLFDAMYCIHCIPAIVLMYIEWDKENDWSRVHGARNRLVMENI